MVDNGKEQLLLKLQQLFDGKEDLISSGELRVCLTATVISFLNNYCFHDSQYYPDSQKDCVELLKRCIPSVHTLKIVAGPTFKLSSPSTVDISRFHGLQVLEISKLAIGCISGLQSLRAKIKYLKASRSINKIDDVLVLCGGDQSTEFAWPNLDHTDFSFNNINQLDSSLRLLTSLKSLDLSHNNLAEAEKEHWMYLPDVTWLNVGDNQITKVPYFPESSCSKITTLFLTNNDLDSLEGLEALSNLEILDVSMNCICNYSSCFPLACLDKLVSLKCTDNPIAYHKDYRSTLISCLSPSPRNVPIVFDGQLLDLHEMCLLGNRVEVDLSSFIPSRPYGSPVNLSHSLDSDIVFEQSTEEIIPARTPEKKRRSRKTVIRQPSILNTDDKHDRKTVTLTGNDTAESSEELEKLEKFKKDAGEDYLVVRNLEEVKHNKVKELAIVALEKEVVEASSSTTQPEKSPEENSFLEGPPPTKTEVDRVVDGCFLVSASTLLPAGKEPDSENVFVSVKEHDILEHDINLKVKLTLDLHSLLDVKVTRTEKCCTARLKFDYVNERKKNREYVFMGDEDEQRIEDFINLIKQFIRRPAQSDGAAPKNQIKCLNCSAIFTEDKDVTECSRCKSPMLFDVTQSHSTAPSANTTHQMKSESLSVSTLPQDPDIIPKVVKSSDVPPDVCNSSLEQDKNDFTEYGTLVSTIKLKSKDFEDSFKEPESSDLSISPTRNTTAAVDISREQCSPRTTKTLYRRLREGSSSPLDSFASSSSDHESRRSTPSRTPTPVGERQTSAMYFSMDSCTHCDHRLKLYFETRMFKGGNKEEFCCMIKCPAASYGDCQGAPGLLVISNLMTYICKITGFESVQPHEWLILKASYLHTDLRHLEYGLNCQSFRLEFAQASGCHTFLVGDSKRCESFLQALRGIVKKTSRENPGLSVTVSKANPQTLANIRIQVFGVKDESLIVKGQRLYEQIVNFTHPPLVKDRKSWFRTLPQSMLGREFIDWLISHKEATSYREAVQVGQIFLDAGVIQCFDNDSSLLDADQYYYFNLQATTSKSNANNSAQSDKKDSTEIDTTIKQYFLGKWDKASNKRVLNKQLVPVSIIVSTASVALAEENCQWPLPRFHEPPVSLSGPQFVFITKQRIINITEMNIFGERVNEIAIGFYDEDKPGDDRNERWLLSFETENSLEAFLEGIKEVWEEQFGVELPLNFIEEGDT